MVVLPTARYFVLRNAKITSFALLVAFPVFKGVLYAQAFDSFRHCQTWQCEESVAGGVCFRLFLDVRYNDDHTGQALLDHTFKVF